MSTRQRFVWPADKQAVLNKAIGLQWITLAVFGAIVGAMYLVLGDSQAMKTAWIEDILALIAPVAFLIVVRVERMAPNRAFPWGFLRAISIAYVVAATALLAMGLFLAWDAGSTLLAGTRPTIGAMTLLGEEVWLGWPMLAVLVASSVPPMIIGRMKLPLARALHDKVLYADAEMCRAEWMTGGAAILGIAGIGFGLWWADSVAALIISVDIVRDGAVNLSRAVRDLLDRRPTTVERDRPDPLIDRVEDHVARAPWVKDSIVSLRTEGRALTGDIVVVPAAGQTVSAADVDALRDAVEAIDWRLYDIAVAPSLAPPGGVSGASDLP